MRGSTKSLGLVLTAVASLVMLADYFVTAPPLQALSSILREWAVIITGAALVLAGINIVLVHSRRVAERKQGFDESLVLLVFMSIMLVAGFISRNSPVFVFLFDNVMRPVGTTLFALLIYWMVSAATRVFKVTDTKGAVLLISGCLLILARAPVGAVIWEHLPAVGDWLMGPPSIAGQRAIVMTGAIGSISVALRVLLGFERGRASVGSSE